MVENQRRELKDVLKWKKECLKLNEPFEEVTARIDNDNTVIVNYLDFKKPSIRYPI